MSELEIWAVDSKIMKMSQSQLRKYFFIKRFSKYTKSAMKTGLFWI